METLKQYLERCYDNDYTTLSNEIRNIALDYAMVRLQLSVDKGIINAKSPDYVYLLQLVADAIDRMGEQNNL